MAEDYDRLERQVETVHIVPTGASLVVVEREEPGVVVSGLVEAMGRRYRFEQRHGQIHILRKNEHGSWQALPMKAAVAWRDLVERELRKVI